ncbi:Com2 protein [Saccharomycopsis crataegensis]|uniref:Com2 protein n=1 Tax=Saccharomycopsis crataegensis TaxID=43959 RepID=A0AAV5QDZ4_9ASCO|nr:Com2 protein [Saccharomycopsis crataegensis]
MASENCSGFHLFSPPSSSTQLGIDSVFVFPQESTSLMNNPDKPNLGADSDYLLNQIYSRVNLLNVDHHSSLSTMASDSNSNNNNNNNNSRGSSPNAYQHEAPVLTPNSHMSLSPPSTAEAPSSSQQDNFYLLQNNQSILATSSAIDLPENDFTGFMNGGGNHSDCIRSEINHNDNNKFTIMPHDLTSSHSAMSSPLHFTTTSKLQHDSLMIDDNLSVISTISPNRNIDPPEDLALSDFDMSNDLYNNIKNDNDIGFKYDDINNINDKKEPEPKTNTNNPKKLQPKTEKPQRLDFRTSNGSLSSLGRTFTFSVNDNFITSGISYKQNKPTPLRIPTADKSKAKHNREGSLCTMMGKTSLQSPITPISASSKKKFPPLCVDIPHTTKDFKMNDHLSTPIFQTSVLDFSNDNKKKSHKVQKSGTAKSSIQKVHKKSQSLSSQSLTNLSHHDLVDHKKLSNASSTSIHSLANNSSSSINNNPHIMNSSTNTPIATPINNAIKKLPPSLNNLRNGGMYSSSFSPVNSSFTNLQIPNKFVAQKIEEPSGLSTKMSSNNNNNVDNSFVLSLLSTGEEPSDSESFNPTTGFDAGGKNYFFNNESVNSFVDGLRNEKINQDDKIKCENFGDFLDDKDLAKFSGDENDSDNWKPHGNPFDNAKSSNYQSPEAINDADKNFIDQKQPSEVSGIKNGTTINPSKLTSPVSSSFNNFLKFKASKSIDFNLDNDINKILPLATTTEDFMEFGSVLDAKANDMNGSDVLRDSDEDLASDGVDTPNYKALFNNVSYKMVKKKNSKTEVIGGEEESTFSESDINDSSRKIGAATKATLKEKLIRKKSNDGEFQHKSSISSMAAKLKSPILNKRNKSSSDDGSGENGNFPNQFPRPSIQVPPIQSPHFAEQPIYSEHQMIVQKTYSELVNAARNRAGSINSSVENLSTVNSLNGGASSVFSANTTGASSIYSTSNETFDEPKRTVVSDLNANKSLGNSPDSLTSMIIIASPHQHHIQQQEQQQQQQQQQQQHSPYTSTPLSVIDSRTPSPEERSEIEEPNSSSGGTQFVKQPNRRGRKPSLQYDPTKIFSCTLCPRKFKRQEHLKRHFRSLHTGEKPFGCNICGKKFSRSDNLGQHLKTHSS